ncbi:MAG: MFS transporter [Rhodospirillales bacterium]|nr:MFS transporter [Rhodospirillales bacterium]MBO6788062.1 MFS transporter [Rhodospirillales bacterium]
MQATFIRVFVPFALGYLLSYLLRVVNAVIAPALIEDLGLSASDLGLLTSANLFAFAAFQLPLGVLLDRYGPRRTEAVLLIIAAAGTAVFALAGSLALLIMGRAMIGLGTSACLMAAFTAYAIWLPKERLPAVNGYQMVAGGIGALIGTTPIEYIEELLGWRGVFWVLTGVALVMAAIVYFVVPERKDPGHGSETFREAIGGVRRVFWSPLFWRVAPLCVSSQAAFLGIQSLWLGPWFHDVMELDNRATADALFLVACAMVASYMCLAVITGYLSRRGVGAIRISVIGMSVFIVMQLVVVFELAPVNQVTWMVWAFTATYGIVSYAGLTQRFPTSLAGRVVTAINLLAFFGAFAVQWGVGVIIDFWPLTASGGFHPEGYRWAFGIVAGVQIVALIWFLIFRTERVVESHA